ALRTHNLNSHVRVGIRLRHAFLNFIQHFLGKLFHTHELIIPARTENAPLDQVPKRTTRVSPLECCSNIQTARHAITHLNTGNISAKFSTWLLCAKSVLETIQLKFQLFATLHALAATHELFSERPLPQTNKLSVARADVHLFYLGERPILLGGLQQQQCPVHQWPVPPLFPDK